MLLHKISRYRPQFLWFIIWSASIYLFITEITPTYFPSVPDRPSTLSRAGPVAKRSNPARIPSLVRAVAYTTNKVKKRQSKQEVLGLDKPEGRFCSEKEYLDGEWVEREEPLRDFDDVRRAYQFGEDVELKCQAVDDSVHRISSDPEYRVRVLEAAKYEWKPKSGCKKYPFDRISFAKRCLRSKAGFTLVGDSLTEHHYHVLVGLMHRSDGLFIWSGTPDNIFHISLNPGHPLAIPLLNAARVSHDRVHQPLVNFYRDHHTLSRAELDETFKGVIGYVPYAGRTEENLKIKWVAEETKWWNVWRNERFAVGVGFNTGQLLKSGRPVEAEKSVLVFNVGPHWSRGEIAVDPPQMSLQAVADGYTKMVAAILDKLNTLPKTEVLAFWRATSPGDPECEQYPAPVNNRTSHFSAINPIAEQFNWNAYPEMNRHVSSRLSYKPSDDPHRLRAASEPMRYLDAWTLSLGRPDAHLKPAIDCMHYCIPSVPNEWMAFTWHLMVIDAANDDYINQEDLEI